MVLKRLCHYLPLMSKLIGEFPKSSLSVDPQNIVTCAECEGTNIVFDPEMGEKFCQSCGIVLAEKLESSESDTNIQFEKDQSGLHTGMPSSLTQADKGLSTVIPYSVTDGNGTALNAEQRGNMQRIIRWNKISNTNRSYHRNLKNAFSLLLRVKDKLSLSDPITEKAAYYYRKTLDLNVIKGRSIKGFVVACVYTACREAGALRSMEEISKEIDTDKVFAGKCYRLLLRRLRIRLPEIDARSHLSRIASNAGVSEKSLRKAADMMAVIKENPVSYGKDPNALAVAVLYGACLAQGEKVSQVNLSQAANMSIVTLRKRLLDVRKVFPEIPNGPNALKP